MGDELRGWNMDGSGERVKTIGPRGWAASLLAATVLLPAAMGAQAVSAKPGQVRVMNAQLVRDGQPWIPHGFHQIAFVVPPGGFDAAPPFFRVAAENYSPQEYADMRMAGGDSVRIQVAENGIDPKGMHYTPDFATKVMAAVRAARSAGLTVIVSIQNEQQTGEAQKPVELPSDATQRVWEILAPAFRDDHGVLYEIFNEPRIRPMPPQGPSAEQWQRWADAMNRMIRVIRSRGAENVVVADGLQRAETLNGVPELKDPLHQVVYASHPYTHGPQDQCPDAWRTKFGELSFPAPVLISEWGIGYYCDIHTPKATERFLEYLQARGIGLEIGTWDWAMPNFGSFNYGFPNPKRSSFEGGVCSGREIPPGFGPGKMVERWYKTGSPVPATAAGQTRPGPYEAYCRAAGAGR